MKVPFGCNITDPENHGGYKYLMGPKSIEQEVVKHDNSSIAFSSHFSKDFSRGLVFRGTNSVNHWADGSHPK